MTDTEKIIKKGLNILMLILVFNSVIYGQEYCSHHRSASFIQTSVSPNYSRLQDCYDVKFYDLEIESSDTSAYIKASNEITILTLEAIDTVVFELDSFILVGSVSINDQSEGDYFQQDNLLFIVPGESLSRNTINRVKIWYEGGKMSSGFFSGISNRSDFTYNNKVTYTLSEPFQSSKWFPVKQNLYDKADSVRVSVITDTTLLAGSNGLLTGKEILEGDKIRYTWESRYPIAYYLISIAVSDYIDYSFYVPFDDEDDSLLVQNFIYDHPDIFALEKERIDRTGELIRFFNAIYGTYPFKNEKYGHSMAPMGGGMEHQTMTTLQSFSFDLVAHELAHQWFGNNVTCGTWQDIWINEGFASYSEYLAREFLIGLPEAIEWMDNAHGYALREKDGSIFLTNEEALDASRIFSFSLSYKKGAAILHMLRNEINDDELFFRAFRKFQEIYKDSVAVAEDFLFLINEITGEDYTWFFDQWYYGKGYPILQATWKYRADSLFIQTYQGSSSDQPEFFRMHMDFLIEYEDGTDTLLRVFIDDPEKSFSFFAEKKVVGLQMDPMSKTLMNSTLYEYIPENNSVVVSPNPFKDTLYIDFQVRNSSKRILITDLQGRVIVDKEMGKVRSAELSLPDLVPGIYLIVIDDGEKKNAMRVVKL